MNPIHTLQQLESTFLEAAQLAYDMQKGVRSYNKRETGNPVGDIVTEADLAVQEFLLKAMSKTELVDCRLIAEEDTPTTALFKKEGPYYLGIDPIDDTAIYAKGGEHFSTIITLHDGKRILYVFVHFPAWNWTHKVVSGFYSVSGKTPDLALPTDANSTVLFWRGNPQEHIPTDVLAELKGKGVTFQQVSHASNFGTIGTFASGKVAGVYHENMNAYDGIVEFSIASARGDKVYSSGAHGPIDLTDIQEREKGVYYPGYYLALNDTFST